MKKFVVFTSLILLNIINIGCSLNIPSPTTSINSEVHASVSEQNISSDNQESVYPGDELFKDASPDNFRQESSFDHEQIKNEMFDIVKRCSEIYDGMKWEHGFFLPTAEDLNNITDVIANEGHIVIAPELNMRNSDLLKDAYNKIQSGQQGEFCIYYVDPLAQITRTSFLHKDGITFYTNPYMVFDDNRNPIYHDTDLVRALDVFFISDKGYLIYGANGTGFAGFGSAYRVEPLSEECRYLKKKYLEPLGGYLGHNVFLENWNQGNMKQVINFNDAFDVLYESHTGMRPHDVFKDTFAGIQAMAVPSKEFETIITKYFPVTADELRNIAVYDKTNDVYAWPFMKGDAYSQDFEVIDYKYNSDGSLTMIFDALNLSHGDDCNATNTLTVMPKSDGSFQYISNAIAYYPEKEPWNLTYYPSIKKQN